MTTVAYRDGFMACDSCWSSNGVRVISAIKMRRLSSGAILGEAGDGDIRTVVDLLDKAKSYKAMPSRADLAATRTTFGGILVLPNRNGFFIDIDILDEGKGDHFQASVEELHDDAIAAIGSGREFALGAMGAGADPATAVAIACGFDIWSALPVHVLEL